MKLIKLDLLAFGPFSNLSLDLADGAEGLHVVYGPNEAGKSSALRALRQILYGIPVNSSDNFDHNYKELRVGATLRKRDGSTFACIRRKANKNSLRAADDETAIDESVLRPFLGGVDEDAFRTVFGINHDTLVRGGAELARGSGEIGEMLFTAGAGLAGVRGVQEKLEAAMVALFKPGGSNPLINAAVSELDDARRTQRDAELPTTEWVNRDKALRADRTEFDRVDAELKMKQRELRRFERIHAALPVIAQFHDAEAALRQVADAVLLPKDFGRQRHEALVALNHATTDRSTAGHTVAELDAKLAGIIVPEATLAEADVIELLHKRLGVYHKAMEDRRTDLVPNFERLRADSQAFLNELGAGRTLEQVNELRLTTAERVLVQNLGVEHGSLQAACDNGRNRIHECERLLDAARRELEQLPESPETADLRRAIGQAQRAAGLEDDSRKLRHGLRLAEHQFDLDLRKMSLFAGTADELEKLGVPPTETIERFRGELEQHATACDGLAQSINDIESELADLDGKLDQLQLEQDVPTEESLAAARSRREAGWQLVRRAWLVGEPMPAGAREYIAEHPPAADLAAAFEASVQAADLVADRIRREAKRVAELAKLQADRLKAAGRLDRLRQQLATRQRDQAASLDAWRACWQSAGIAPRTPQEMSGWLKQHADLVRRCGEIRERRSDLAELDGRLNTQRRALADQLTRFDEPAAADESLGVLIERCEAVASRHETTARRRTELRNAITKLELELKEARRKATETAAALETWRGNWSSAIKRLPLPPDPTPAQANAVLGRMAELFGKIEEANSLRGRMDKIDGESAEFARDVEQAVVRLAPDRAGLPFDQAAALLHAQLGHARQLKQQFDGLAEQRRKEQAKLEKASEIIRTTRSQLDAMCAEAGCESDNELAAAEERSTRRREFESRIAELRQQVLSHSGGAAIDAFIAEAAQCDADSLVTDIARLGERIEELARQRDALGQKIAVDDADLRKLDGSSAAADAAERVQELLAQIDSRSREYVRLRLASAVLRQAIERYRDKHQGSVLQSASRLFAGLTLHSFEGLKAEYNDKGDAELVGVRPGGKTVEVAGLSDGTRDQLYLALRLASLETYFSRPDSEPLPFIVDDVLLNFDDDRAAAALRALGALSNRTQVIFFTHHRRLVEVAREHVDGDTLIIHELSAREPASSSLEASIGKT
jgi:uncharacterized protein YhaN